MAVLNAAGLVVYRCVRDRVAVRVRQSRLSYWKLNAKRLFLAGAVGLTVSAIAQYLLYAHFGGVTGYLDAFTYDVQTMDASDAFDTDNALAGLGWLIMVTDCFPILAIDLFRRVGKTGAPSPEFVHDSTYTARVFPGEDAVRRITWKS